MTKIPKIAPKDVVNRKQTPIMEWIRNKLLAVDRSDKTPPPGLPTEDNQVNKLLVIGPLFHMTIFYGLRQSTITQAVSQKRRQPEVHRFRIYLVVLATNSITIIILRLV